MNAPAMLLMVKLTDAQRQQILEQTGQDIAAVPYESGAAVVHCDFGGITLQVARGVFVPAGATEHLLHTLLAAVAGREDPIIIDVGTGCGALALAAGHALPRASIVATDTSQEALQCARANRARLGIPNVRFCQGSLLSTISARYRGWVSAIAGNVPYLPPRLGRLAEAFPEGTAIGVDADGLGLPRKLALSARDFLEPGGALVLQLAGFQWESFSAELVAMGYEAPTLNSAALDVPVSGRCAWPGLPTEAVAQF